MWCLAVFLGITCFSYSSSLDCLKKMKAIRVTFQQLSDHLNLWPLLPCFPSGPGAVGHLPRPVHGGRRRRPRGHQPHSETTQEGGTIISGALQALETGVTHHTPLVNLSSQCLMNRIWHTANSLAKLCIGGPWAGEPNISLSCLRGSVGRQRKIDWEKKITE